jgi:hypothetical protein
MTYVMDPAVRDRIEELAAIVAAAPADVRLVLCAVADIPLPEGDVIRTQMPREVILAARRCVG